MCIEVGRVRADEARDRLQTKTKHYNMIFSSIIYINIIRGTQREYSSKPLEHSIVKRILVFKR